MRNLIIFFVIIVLAGCAGKATPIPNADTAGGKVYREKCSQCHSLPHPKRHTFFQWEGMLAVMEQRMAERNLPKLTKDEKANILSYLKDNGR